MYSLFKKISYFLLLCLTVQSLAMDRPRRGGGGGGGAKAHRSEASYIDLGYVLKQYKKDSFFFDVETRFFGEKILRGKVTVYPIRVLDQKSAIGGQAGNFTCGFHSLRNSILFLKLIDVLKSAKTDSDLRVVINNHYDHIISVSEFNKTLVGPAAAQERGDMLAFHKADQKSWLGYAKTLPEFIIGEEGGLYTSHIKLLKRALEKGLVNPPMSGDETLPRVFSLNNILAPNMTYDDFESLSFLLLLFFTRESYTSFAVTTGQGDRQHVISLLVNKSTPKNIEIAVFDSSATDIGHYERLNKKAALVLAQWLADPIPKMRSAFEKAFGTASDEFSGKATAELSEFVKIRRRMRNESREFKTNRGLQINFLREMGQFVKILSFLTDINKYKPFPPGFIQEQNQMIVTTMEDFFKLVKEIPLPGLGDQAINFLTNNILSDNHEANKIIVQSWLNNARKNLDKLRGVEGGGGGAGQ